MKWLVSVIVATLAIFGGYIYHVNQQYKLPTKESSQYKSTVVTPVSPPTVQELFNLVNIERSKVGAPPLKLDDRLNKSAQLKADDMTKYNYFNHVNPKTGKHGYEYFRDFGVRCVVGTGGENLTQNTVINDSEHAVQAWMNSVPHKKAMLDPTIDIVGYGVSGANIVMHLCDVL